MLRKKESVNMFKRVLWKIARFAAKRKIIWPFLLVYKMVIKEIKAPVHIKGVEKITLLALNSTRFRNDLEILSESGRFRMLKIPPIWQNRLLSIYWGPRPIEFNKCYNPDKYGGASKLQKELRNFLRAFLPLLYKLLKVDCVIGATVHYVQDYDWGVISEEVGVPYIVLHRENLMASPKALETNRNRLKIMGKFKGSHIIVQNEVILKDVFLQSSYIAPDRISAHGCLRMDKFVEKIKESACRRKSPRKKAVLFSFHHGTGFGVTIPVWSKKKETGFVKLFEHTHAGFAKAALENPGADFIIKAKWGGDWPGRIRDAVEKNNMKLKNIPNLKIVHDINAHDLILESDVICGFGSTTLLEGAVASRPVIVPYFDEAVKPEYKDFILLKDDLDLFDVALNTVEFEGLIKKRLNDPKVSDECMSKRCKIFEKYISSMKKSALLGYTEIFEQVLEERKKENESIPRAATPLYSDIRLSTSFGS